MISMSRFGAVVRKPVFILTVVLPLALIVEFVILEAGLGVSLPSDRGSATSPNSIRANVNYWPFIDLQAQVLLKTADEALDYPDLGVTTSKYKTTCGGLDSSFSYGGAADDLLLCIDKLAPRGHVCCEGVIAITSYGHKRMTRFADKLKRKGHRMIFANIDTPVELCIERVEQRRMEAGNLKHSIRPSCETSMSRC